MGWEGWGGEWVGREEVGWEGWGGEWVGREEVGWEGWGGGREEVGREGWGGEWVGFFATSDLRNRKLTHRCLCIIAG